MLYCHSCGEQHELPLDDLWVRMTARCEICGEVEYCLDVPVTVESEIKREYWIKRFGRGAA